MTYVLQMNCYALLLYGMYILWLKNNTRYSWSRMYLLLCAVLPALLPLIHFSWPVDDNNSGVATILLPAVTVASHTKNVLHFSVTADNMLMAVYAISSLFLLARLAIQYRSMRRFISQHAAVDNGNFKLLLNTGVGPASWGRYIFLPEETIDSAVLRHEAAHIQLHHSRDLLAMRLTQCLLWPNIILVAMAKELKAVHEFQADAIAGTDTDGYSRMLLNEIMDTRHFSLTHTFFHYKIKRRIAMLHKKRSSATSLVFSLLSAAVIITTGVGLQSCQQTSNNVTAAATIVAHPEKAAEPSFDLNNFMATHIKYPDYAKTHNIQGRVVMRFTIDKNGNVLDVKAVHSPDTSLTRAAMATIAQMPKWTPAENGGQKVATQFYLPVMFKL